MVAKNEYRLRQEIVRVTRIGANQSLIRSSDGNISIRIDQDRFLVTPSGLDKMSMEPDDLIIVNQLSDPIPLPGYDMTDYGKLENESVR
ncbi:MAG: class II aldolase/adducin family protein [Anaerolineales bacterium]